MRKRITWLFKYSGFLVFGTVGAVIWANLIDYHSYEHFLHKYDCHFWVNDVCMAFFFAIAGKEIFEAMLPGGDLSSPRKSATPLIAAVGGMVVPAGLYFLCCLLWIRPDLYSGAAIPCATDIVFASLVARLMFGAGHVAVTFLLLLAVIDDALGLVVLAVFYQTGTLNVPLLFTGVGGAMAFSFFILNRLWRMTNFWWYAIPGVISWLAFYKGGVHPALSLVPIIFTMPHAKDDRGLYVQGESERPDALNQFEHFFKNPVEIMLGFFGLVNAGVVLGSIGFPTAFVLFGLLIGKPIGIVLFTLIAMRIGFKLADGLTMRHVNVIGCIAGFGFTVSIFMSVVAFPDGGSTLDAAKMGALLSFTAIGVAFLAKWLLFPRTDTAKVDAVSVAPQFEEVKA